MKYIFIVNPIAGNGKSLEVIKNIENVCKEDSIDYIIHYTSKPKEATDLARIYKDDQVIVFAVGGDGTLSEVVNGLVETKNILGIIPVGTGNDFYKALRKVEPLYKTIDLGRVNGKYFINTVSVGIDAEAGHNANKMKNKKLIPNSQIYNFSIIYTLFAYKFKKIKFEFNGMKKEGKYTFVTVCNGNYYGNGFNIAPNAKIDDHLFDVYFVNKISKFKIPKAVLELERGTHEKEKFVNKEKTDLIKISSENKLICNVDGETIIDDTFYIEMVKEALTIYNNKDFIRRILNLEEKNNV